MHVNLLNAFLAQAAPAGAPQGNILTGFFVPMGLMVVIMYFLMIRPQQKRAKEQAKMLEALKSGDRVSTATGIIGTVVSVKDKVVTLRSADSKLEVAKSAVTEILEANNPATN
jgi:preprotein translocase subunit YajC